MTFSLQLGSRARSLLPQLSKLVSSASTSHARRHISATTAPRSKSALEELAAVQKWRDNVLGKSSILWDRMDPRQLTLLDQSIRPYLPASYPSLPRDARVGDVAEGTPIPPAAYLVYFPAAKCESELAPDGYFADEAPPDPFGQRVWAGGVMNFSAENPLRVGELTSQTKRIEDVKIKERSGMDPLVIVRLVLEMYNSRGLCATENRDLAYMKPIDLQRKTVKHNRQPDFGHELVPSEILLFRYSALSWNSHRIHYDAVYARETERHPGLLVHGPLTCTLLLQLLEANMPQGMALKSFDYRAVSPMYCQQGMRLNGRWMQAPQRANTKCDVVGPKKCELWSTNDEGGISMKGVATIVPRA
ncbi:hypothetical protein LPJ66_000345 [Kickxella alabastrina]|uniref:Uncharacterized protein n=1 Tax=Kickxella alabastrina TaxID=61397 RepID=A0ACC1IWE1_9FUNG|nr:hypothetical protein LPJ66_000345 [Kickxella alabastrina]